LALGGTRERNDAGRDRSDGAKRPAVKIAAPLSRKELGFDIYQGLQSWASSSR
jgi:hypothetical protein